MSNQKLRFKTVPRAARTGWRAGAVYKGRLRLLSGTKADPRGVLYWEMTGTVVPPRIFDENYVELPEHQEAAYEAETAAFLAAYRRNPPKRTAEDRAEMRAAFGPGEVIRDVITGETWTI